MPQVQGIVCRTHRPPLYLHHRPPSLHPLIQQNAVSLWGRRASFFFSVLCPNYVSHDSLLTGSNEAGGGAQGVFRVVVHCGLLLSVDSVCPWALPAEEGSERTSYHTCNLPLPGSSTLFLIKTMPGRLKTHISELRKSLCYKNSFLIRD